MSRHVKPVDRALELLQGAPLGDVSPANAGENAVDDCASWVIEQVTSTIEGLAQDERLDAESVALVLQVIHDMEREALKELGLAARRMEREELERQESLRQRIAELEARLGITSAPRHQVAV